MAASEPEKRRKRGRPVHIPSPWGDLAAKLGGSEKLAEHLGIAKSTLNKWANQIHRVPETAKKEVRRLCEHHGVECHL